MAADRIRIDDLRHPVLTEAARQALAFAEANPVELTEDATLSAAREMTGLDDFGPDAFRAGVRRRLATPGNALVRAETFRAVVHYARNRLLLQDLLNRHPEIHRLPVREPIVIVGPPRSGTSYLHGLLACDPRLRGLRYGEVLEPFQLPRPIPDSIRAAAWFIDYGNQQGLPHVLLPHVRPDLLPYLGVMHELAPRDVAEEWPLVLANFPIGSDDMRPHYEYLRTVLKALQWRHGLCRWILKVPSYCANLPPLLETFPDATVVMTHRDPAAIVASLATMSSYARRLEQEGEVDVAAVLEMTAAQVEGMLRARMRDRGLIPEGLAVDVLFHELTADPLATLGRVCRAAGLDLTEEQRRRVAEFQDEHRRFRGRGIAYDLRADFGVTSEQVLQRFSFYADHVAANIGSEGIVVS